MFKTSIVCSFWYIEVGIGLCTLVVVFFSFFIIITLIIECGLGGRWLLYDKMQMLDPLGMNGVGGWH